MSRGGARHPKLKTATPSSTPIQSTTSFSSGETIKASKSAPKSVFKELLGGGGNNKSLPKVPKSERILVSGRGGARKGAHKPESPPTAGPSNSAQLDAFIASVSSHQDEETATVSSIAPSTDSAGSDSSKSQATIRHAVRVATTNLLGGGGNDHGVWKIEPEFHTHYGRGGAYRTPTLSSNDSGIEILSEAHSTSSSLSIARNSNGLFFFGRGRRSSEDSDDGDHTSFLVVGPGEGIIHPMAPHHTPDHPFHNVNKHASNSALTQTTMNKSGMSKISVKIAVKQVLGGGGNDDGEWKYIDVFYPSFGRGGEGARGLFVLDDIFNPFKVYPPRARTGSFISFPSISSDTSSIYASSVTSGSSSFSSGDDQDNFPESPQEDLDEFLNNLANHDPCFRDERAPSRHAHFVDSATPSPLSTEPASYHDVAPRSERTMSESSQAVHSEELIRFRDNLVESRRKRLEAQSKSRDRQSIAPAVGEGDSIRLGLKVKRDVSVQAQSQTGSSTSKSPTIRYFPSPPTEAPPKTIGPVRPTVSIPRPLPVMPAPTASAPSIPLADCFAPTPTDSLLAYHLALVQSRTETIRTREERKALSLSLVQIEEERHALAREREQLAARVGEMQKDIARRQRTIEGLTWLVQNLPEHEGMHVVVKDEHEMDEETVALMRQAEEELLQGFSHEILNENLLTAQEEPALPDSPIGAGIAV